LATKEQFLFLNELSDTKINMAILAEPRLRNKQLQNYVL